MNKVSIIVPSIRPDNIASVLANYHQQDYPNKEIIVNCDPDITIGMKRNLLCEAASGDIILHMDDDDFYADDWITKSVQALTHSEADLVGLKEGYFYNIQNGIGKYYSYPLLQGYCMGATMCYWKATWGRNPFNEKVKSGEDSLFCANAGHIFNHNYIDGFTALIHGGNTCSHRAFITMRIIQKEKVPYVKHQQ